MAGIAQALGKCPRDRGVVVLVDSTAAIQADMTAGSTGKAGAGE